MTYCSQCKNSQYDWAVGKKMLLCSCHEVAGVNKYLHTNCTHANVCKSFVPERKVDTSRKTLQKWKHDCTLCGIDWRDYLKQNAF